MLPDYFLSGRWQKRDFMRIATLILRAVLPVLMTLPLTGCFLFSSEHPRGKKPSAAEAAYALGDYQTAAGLFHTQALQGNQKYDSYYYEGMSFFNQGNYARAIVCFESASRIGATDQQRARALAGKGRALIRIGDGPGAVKIFNTILRTYAAHYPEAEALCGLQMAQALAGDYTAAEQTRATLRAKHPESRCPGFKIPPAATSNPTSAPIVIQNNAPGTQALYRVRLTGRFADRQAARAVAAQLREANIDAAVIPLPGGAAFAVQAGAFSSAAAAQKQMQAVQAAGFTARVE